MTQPKFQNFSPEPSREQFVPKSNDLTPSKYDFPANEEIRAKLERYKREREDLEGIRMKLRQKSSSVNAQQMTGLSNPMSTTSLNVTPLKHRDEEHFDRGQQA